MKVAVIGGRDFSNHIFAFEKLSKLNKMQTIVEIVSGGATGADAIGKAYASHNSITYKEFPALWSDLSHSDALIRERHGRKYDARAGFRRNRDIVNYADIVIAFWDGKSKGTVDSIKYANEIKKPLKIFYY